MIAVSNTSPLTNLAAIGRFNLLRDLYDQIHIPSAVWNELNAYDQGWPGRDEVAAASWIERHTVTDNALVVALQRDLDRGEAESIALALELRADLILLDEADGRHIAQRLELRSVGVLGILLEAKKKGLISAVHPFLIALRQSAGFYISDMVFDSVLRLAGEPELGN